MGREGEFLSCAEECFLAAFAVCGLNDAGSEAELDGERGPLRCTGGGEVGNGGRCRGSALHVASAKAWSWPGNSFDAVAVPFSRPLVSSFLCVLDDDFVPIGLMATFKD